MKCLVKENGKRCSRVAVTRGQCNLHHAYFTRLVKIRKMTWEFLLASGESLPPLTTRNTKKLNDKE